MLKTKLICVFLSCCCLIMSTISSECSIKLDNDEHSPIILLASTGKWYPLTYSPRAFLRVPINVSVRLICPDTPTNRNAFTSFPKDNDLISKCKEQNRLEIHNQTYSFETLRCSRPPIPTLVGTGKSCLGPIMFNTTYMYRNWEIFSIGFSTRHIYLEVYDVCFDKQRLQVLYAHNTVLPDLDKTNGILEDDAHYKWISEKELFNFTNMDTEYNCHKQEESFRRINEQFLSSDERCCFDKAQLVNAADVVFHAQKIATFHDINTVPRCVLKSNWMEVERRVRKLSTSLRHPLAVWTGTHTPTDTFYVDKELFIHYEGRGEKSIPVPLFLWKVVYDPATEKSLAVIGINDHRWSHENAEKLRLCQDLCERVNWMKFPQRLDANIGYVYCCDLNTFKVAFKFEDSPFPKENNGLLLDESGSSW